jgi:hypothetical protein
MSKLALPIARFLNPRLRHKLSYTTTVSLILSSGLFALPCRAVDDYSPTPLQISQPIVVWPTELPPDTNSPLLNLVQTISGKPASDKITRLLNGVVEVHTTENGIEFVRNDSVVLSWDISTTDGDQFFRSWEELSQQAGRYLGPSASTYLMGLNSIKVFGDFLEINDSVHRCVISIPQQKRTRFFTLEAIRLKDIRLAVDRENGQLWIKRMSGVEALLRTGDLQIPLQVREFSRKKDEDGQTVLTFGFLPSAFSTFHALLEPYRVSFTINTHSDSNQETQAPSE